MVKIKDEKWRELLHTEGEKEYFPRLWHSVMQDYATHTCFPPKEKIFRALDLCSYDDVKVVLLGQDPYHEIGQANGLCFSVEKGVKLPPSLINVYKALEYDLGIKPDDNGDLTGWAKQGVLMLNSYLSVRQGQALSHAKWGWDKFTDRIIQLLNEHETPIVFMLWGGYAKSKSRLITNPKHLILQAVHPSPLSFHHGFLECRHFSKANAFLQSNGLTEIDWSKKSEI